MTTWEYLTTPLLIHNTAAILNNWGKQGWELVQVVPGPEGGLVAYLKRPVGGGDAPTRDWMPRPRPRKQFEEACTMSVSQRLAELGIDLPDGRSARRRLRAGEGARRPGLHRRPAADGRRARSPRRARSATATASCRPPTPRRTRASARSTRSPPPRPPSAAWTGSPASSRSSGSWHPSPSSPVSPASSTARARCSARSSARPAATPAPPSACPVLPLDSPVEVEVVFSYA